MENARDGYRWVIAVVLAGVTLGALLVMAGVAMFSQGGLSSQSVVVGLILLGLHGATLTVAMGRSPWPDIGRALDRGREMGGG